MTITREDLAAIIAKRVDTHVSQTVGVAHHYPTLDQTGRIIPTNGVDALKAMIAQGLQQSVQPIFEIASEQGTWSPTSDLISEDPPAVVNLPCTKITGKIVLFTTQEELDAFKAGLLEDLINALQEPQPVG